MKSETKIYAIEKAIYTYDLNLVELAAASPYPEYLEYFQSNHHASLVDKTRRDISFIKDIVLRRRIVEYLFDSMNPEIIHAQSYCNYRYRALFSLLDRYPNWFAVPYREFCAQIIDEIKNENLQFGRYRALINTFLSYCYKRDYEDNPLSCDIWDTHLFNLPQDRTFGSNVRNFYFGKIKNETNKSYMKKYIEYCIRNTDNSINTINDKLGGNTFILNMREISIDQWTKEDADTVVMELRQYYTVRSSLVSRMMYFFSFIDYLITNDYLQDNPMKRYKELARFGPYNYKSTAVDQYVVNQIFQVLGSISDQRLVLIFLLIYCTGMRISEACAITYDCISTTEAGCFVNYYSSKLRKQGMSVIPKALYDMIHEYQLTINNKEKYLFPSQKKESTHFSTESFCKHFSQELMDLGVINSDGTPYHFTPHSFRHSLAVRMREQNIPFQVIQAQLHHHSPDMTLAYIEYLDRVRVSKMESFINADGNKVEFQENIKEDIKRLQSQSYIEYIRKSINAQILPNGICARPVKLGKCPYSGGCLSCPEFRTSSRFLPVHKQQLCRVQHNIAIAEKEGWLPQVESNKNIEAQLLRLIESLEKMEADHDPEQL